MVFLRFLYLCNCGYLGINVSIHLSNRKKLNMSSEINMSKSTAKEYSQEEIISIAKSLLLFTMPFSDLPHDILAKEDTILKLLSQSKDFDKSELLQLKAIFTSERRERKQEEQRKKIEAELRLERKLRDEKQKERELREKAREEREIQMEKRDALREQKEIQREAERASKEERDRQQRDRDITNFNTAFAELRYNSLAVAHIENHLSRRQTNGIKIIRNLPNLSSLLATLFGGILTINNAQGKDIDYVLGSGILLSIICQLVTIVWIQSSKYKNRYNYRRFIQSSNHQHEIVPPFEEQPVISEEQAQQGSANHFENSRRSQMI